MNRVYTFNHDVPTVSGEWTTIEKVTNIQTMKSIMRAVKLYEDSVGNSNMASYQMDTSRDHKKLLVREIDKTPSYFESRSTKKYNQSQSIPLRKNINGSLVISGATRKHEGNYMCKANSGIGTGLSRVIELTVHGRFA